MDLGVLLAILKYVGFGITAASSLWALIRDPTFKDAEGQKRLTAAGHFTVALILASATTGTVSFALESVVKQQAQHQAEAERKAALDREMLRTAAAQANAATAEVRTMLREATREQRDIARGAAKEQREISRDAVAQSTERMERLEEGQRLLVASQPLRTLSVRLVFSNLTSKQAKALRDGQEAITDYQEGDDELAILDSAIAGQLEQGLRRSKLLYPFLRVIASSPEDRSIILLIDLDGTGAMLLPLGLVAEPAARGFVDTSEHERWNLDMSGANDDAKSPSSPLPALCDWFGLRLGDDGRSLSIDIAVPSHCLSCVVHTQARSDLTAASGESPSIALVTAGTDGLVMDPSNVSNWKAPLSTCLHAPKGPRQTGPRIELTIVPNGVAQLGSQVKFAQGGSVDLKSGGGPESDPLDYGTCVRFERTSSQ